MAKEDAIEVDGVVEEALPNAMSVSYTHLRAHET